MVTDGDASQRAQFSGGQVAKVRGERILDAVVDVVCERGVAGASVGLVITRARVSRRTFYERFDDLEECLVAVLDDALARAVPLVVHAFVEEGPWQDGMRSALAAMLEFFDSEPALTRVCLVELQAATPLVRDHRERILEAFRTLVVARIESEVSHASPLAAEGTHASVVGIVNARLISPEQRPLIELLGPLMGIIVGPFMDEAQVTREIELGHALARELLVRRTRAERSARPPAPSRDRLDPELAAVEIPALLRNSKAERARLCVLYLAEQGALGITPSNRQIATAVGITHKGQVSRLLARLEGYAILSKASHGVGRPNAWRLTPYGQEIAVHIELHESR